MGNPLINELIIGTGSKDTWSMSPPSKDAQFAAFALDPLLARVLNAAFGLAVPDPPRTDLLPLVQYSGPFAGPGSSPGPVADLLRLDTSVPPTAKASRRRLGLLAGDGAGFPNGRRVSDDVTDVALRVVAGVLCPATCTSAGAPFNAATVPLLGDGVNIATTCLTRRPSPTWDGLLTTAAIGATSIQVRLPVLLAARRKS